nr:hypothetical protein [Sphingobium subterraneum]
MTLSCSAQPHDPHSNGVSTMTKRRSYSLRALTIAGAILLLPGIAAAQGQATGQASPQPPMSASGGGMPAGGMMEKHDGMAGMPMNDGMQMPSATPPMAKGKPGCCGMKKMPMAKSKHAKHRRHAKPAAAKRAPMPAADKPMPMQDDM